MSDQDEFTMEMFGIPDPDEPTEVALTAEDITEEELEQRLQTATEEEINAYNDDGIIPPLRESANASLPTEPPAKKERKKREPKQEKVVDDIFRLPGGKGLRQELQKQGLTEVDAIGEIQSNQLTSTDGYLTWAEADAIVREAGIPRNALKKAAGGNRALLPPIDPCFRTFWHGKRKYFRPTACDERAVGLLKEMLAKQAKAKAAKEPKPKKERKVKQVEPELQATPMETLSDLAKPTLVQFLKTVKPEANVSKSMSKAQLLTIAEENGLTFSDYLKNS